MNHGSVIGLLALVASVASVKVPVTVYYESLCPDSQAFINQQIYPTVKNELKDFVDISWVPYGKSTFETWGTEINFTCHHGPNECYGNKVHACAIEHIQANSYQQQFTKESLTLDFINCLMAVGKNFADNVYPGAKCARENNINTWENISNCANSTEGSQLLKKHAELTNSFMRPLKSVPTVVFRQQFDKDDQDRALLNFRGVVCKYIPQPQPRICSSESSAVAMSMSIVPFFAAAAFILSTLY